MCRRWRWYTLNGSFNFSITNFFRSTKSIEKSKESMIVEFKTPYFTLSIQVIRSEQYARHVSSYLAKILTVLDFFRGTLQKCYLAPIT